MQTQSVFIKWQEEVLEFDSWHYVGNGAADPIMKSKMVTRRCRYSNVINDEMIERAKRTIEADFQDKLFVKVVVEND